MYMKIELSSKLIGEISNRVNVINSLVRETESKNLKRKGQTQFAYDVYCRTNDVVFAVLLTFLSHGTVFAYCSCGLPKDKRCAHIEEALLFHQERCRLELEKFFGADAVIEEAVF